MKNDDFTITSTSKNVIHGLMMNGFTTVASSWMLREIISTFYLMVR